MTLLVFHKKAMAFTLSMALTGMMVAPLQASALTTSAPGCKPNSIWAGLWSGVNAATGGNGGCGSASSSTGSTGNGAQTGGYVALGDSVAAGYGLPTTSGADALCPTSAQAYPAIVASSLHTTYRTYACPGATVGDLFTQQHPSGTSADIPAQLPRAFANGTPSLMTITAGANDIYWAQYVQKCYVSTCGTPTDKTVTAGLVAAMKAKLTYALGNIQYRSGGKAKAPRVILAGYYHPISTACLQQQAGLTGAELAWLNNEADILNRAIASVAANYSFARYASVNFTGHELCTANSWVQSPSDAGPFHPTAAGQPAIARAMLSAAR